MSKQNQDTTQKTPKNPDDLSWFIEISTEKLTPKTCKFKTKISSPTLEDAFKIATGKAESMKKDDPEHSKYIVTDIRRA